MRVLYDFQCPDGHITESLVNRGDPSAQCKECGKQAKRIISPIRTYLDPVSGDFPGATAKWERQRKQKIKQEQKTIENHGNIDW